MNGFRELSSGPNNVQDVSVCVGMKSQKEKLTQKRVRELLDYDPETGLLTRKSRRGSAKAGDVIKSVNSTGYVRLAIDSKQYSAHRVIWLWNYGYFPENQVDHINRVKGDNRLCNLREVSAACNVQNSCVSTRNSTGVKGVRGCNQGYQASIMTARQRYSLISTRDFTEAVAHRLAAEQCLGYSSCDNQSSAFVYMQNYVKEKKGSEFTETPS